MNSAVGLNNYATHDQSRYPELWRGCVGAWAPCLGPTGGRLFDFSRNQNWGTLTNMDNATDWVVSDGRYALDFDGDNDHVLLPNNSILRPPSLTASAWFIDRIGVPPVGNLTPGIVYSFATATPSGDDWSLSLINGRVRYTSGANYRDDTSQLSANIWYHLCYVRTAFHSVFLNGVLLTSSSPNLSLGGGWTAGASIGRWFAQNIYTFNGQLDDIRIYNRDLSEPEIRLLATRRGIAYEPARRRRIPQTVAANLRRNHALIGNMF